VTGWAKTAAAAAAAAAVTPADSGRVICEQCFGQGSVTQF